MDIFRDGLSLSLSQNGSHFSSRMLMFYNGDRLAMCVLGKIER